jgi:glycosyltransferase involved in cell wall biosynthesis
VLFVSPADHIIEPEEAFVASVRQGMEMAVDNQIVTFGIIPDKPETGYGYIQAGARRGPDEKKIRSMARRNISFLGYQPTDILAGYLQRARAFVFAAEEDFGITLVEAQACGTPVIAFGKGGALEIVRGLDQAEPTGVFSLNNLPHALRRQ